MELIEALRTTGAVRAYEPEPVSDDVLYRILDTARFAPSGGNRQGWRVIVVHDAAVRRRIRDLYLPGWHEYLAQAGAGLVPWAPVTDRDAEARALQSVPDISQRADPNGFAEHFDEVPAMLVLVADLGALAAVDRDLDRYTLAGGASIYPFAWSILLAARTESLGGVITTMPIRREDEVKSALGVPGDFAIAAVIALGRPRATVTKLRRAAVEDFCTVDRFDGPSLSRDRR
jgi:nitroreductase